MANYNPSNATTTNLSTMQTYSVSNQSLDFANSGDGETYHYFTKATEYLGYYKKIPELKKAVDALAMWTAGKGFETSDLTTKIRLRYLSGWGEDTFDSIIENMIIIKKIIGDSFAEIIRDKDTDILINLKPISPERVRIVVDNNGLIIRYDVFKNNSWKPIKKENMLHLCNERVGDEIHGVSVIEACKWVIEARNEAMDTYRKILKRSLALGVLYIDSEDETKISNVMAKYKTAVEKGEVLVLPKDVAEIRDAKVSVNDFLSWIGYLENFFYQAVGIPKIILGGSQEFTEASSKIGYLTFEQVYMAEQRKLEQDLFKQLNVEIKFNRPVSLKDDIVESEAKNTGQVGMQPNEMMTQVGRNE